MGLIGDLVTDAAGVGEEGNKDGGHGMERAERIGPPCVSKWKIERISPH